MRTYLILINNSCRQQAIQCLANKSSTCLKKINIKKEKKEVGLFPYEVIQNKQTKIKSFFQFKILILLQNSQAYLLTFNNNNTT
jgi:hypothetical protein